MFCGMVARNRRLPARAVVATEGATFLGANGVKRGLADAVADPQAAFEEFAHSLRSRARTRQVRR